MSAAEEGFEPADFVFLGKRVASDEVRVAIARILPDGTLGREWSLDANKHWKGRAVGSVYSGAQFSKDTVRGHNVAKWEREWSDVEARVLWRALDSRAEVWEKAQRYEQTARRADELARLLLPLRKMRMGLLQAGKMNDAYALEEAVARALRKPITVKEAT